MNTLYLIISDIHSNKKNIIEVNNRLEELIGWITRKCTYDDYQEVIIMVAGDIAYSGTKSEYDLIEASFKELAKCSKIVMSPGNHDHNFSSYSGKARDILISSTDEIDDSVIKIVTKGQSEYFDFENLICNVDIIEKTSLSKKYKLSEKTTIQTFNTAWCSKINEKGGELIYPLEQIIDDNDNCEMRILFFHHPLSWLNPDNNKAVRNKISEIANVIISGHEHIENSFKVETDNNTNLTIETCSFHDSELDENGFITFHQHNDDIYIEKHIWDGACYKTTDTKTKSDIVESNSKYRSGFKVRDIFYDELTDIGTGFSHPEINELKINDIFIYQNVNNITSKSTASIKSENSRNILKNYYEKHILLSGEENIGKTTLVRKLCLDTLDMGIFSVYIDGGDIKRADRYTPEKLKEKIESQYENFSFDQLIKRSNERILFIDNFHIIKGDKKSIVKLINLLERYFTKIIVTVSDSYHLSQNEIKGDNVFQENFVSLEILKMGHASRWELIKKWNNLKSECIDSDQLLIIKTDKAYNEISRVIGKNYIPSTPFFLLTMLQSMDTNISADLNTSSYGHYYHYLITCSLGLAGVEKDKLDGIFTYITEMSYLYYKSNCTELSHDALWDFNAAINEDYTLKVDCDSRLSLLIKAKIIKEKSNFYSFKYPYVYYYFLSKYLSDNLNSSEIQEIVQDLVKGLDKRKNMNTLMFLTHHSKDMRILDSIINQSKSHFLEYKPTALDKDVLFINSIISNLNLRDLTFEDGNIHDNRLELEKEKDLHDDNYNNDDINQDDNEPDVDKDSKLHDFLTEFNLTFKSIDLLGQLTRNYHESLKTAPKIKLLTEAIEAPLRALESIFSIMRDDPDTLLEMIRDRLKDEFKIDSHNDHETEIIAKKLLFQLMKGISFSIIKKISSTIGSRELLPVIKLIYKDKPKSNAIRLLELSVQLDLGALGSIENIEKMAKDFNFNTISGALLQDLVGYYLYMFEEEVNNKKRVCSVLKIKYNPLNNKQKNLINKKEDLNRP